MEGNREAGGQSKHWGGFPYNPGTHPTSDILTKFEIRPKFAVLWFKTYFTDHNAILHTSWQLLCLNLYKISLWSG